MFDSLIQKYNKWRLKNTNFTIFSNDCWGAEVYHYFNLAYNTPFIGLYLMAPCYIKFLKKPEYYLSKELYFTDTSKYEQVENSKKIKSKNFPTGVIDDIEIQFLHYESKEEAYQKWNRRKQRINFDNLFIKFDGNKDGANIQLIEEFDQLPYKNKICISNIKINNIQSLIYCPDWEKDGAIMFKKSIKYFNLIKWLNNKGLHKV
ncbi:MAG TPA: DUF1919 domain-containing protein [Bacteroidales bacterium]|nr:DUF1919 domain-containing protein [Bacteroidales bacterium]